MTDKEREIKAAEKKAMAEVRRWKRNTTKKLFSLSPSEREEYYKKLAIELKTEAYNIIPSVNQKKIHHNI